MTKEFGVDDRKLILYIHDGSSIETVVASGVRRDFGVFGYEVLEFSVFDPQAHATLKALLRERGHELFFFYSSNLWALNIRNGDELLHALTGIPLVILMEDHPVYFLHQLSDALKGAVIFVPGEDLVPFVTQHYPKGIKAVANSGVLPSGQESEAATFDDFLRRKNMVLWPMNLSVMGRNIDDVWAIVKGLPERRRARLERLIDAALVDCETPLQVISGRMEADGDPEIAVEDLRWALEFIKLWRRTRMLEMLIDLPILVSTAYAPALLERKYPEKFTLLNSTQTVALYRQYRFVANSFPVLTHCTHERVTDSIANYCVTITDPNAMLKRYFKDDRDMLFVEYTRSDLGERVRSLMDDPRRAFELAVSANGVRKTQNIAGDSVRALLAEVRKRWIQSN